MLAAMTPEQKSDFLQKEEARIAQTKAAINFIGAIISTGWSQGTDSTEEQRFAWIQDQYWRKRGNAKGDSSSC